jgi:hypothetical protein
VGNEPKNRIWNPVPLRTRFSNTVNAFQHHSTQKVNIVTVLILRLVRSVIEPFSGQRNKVRSSWLYWVWCATKCSWRLNWTHLFGVFIIILINFASQISCVLTISTYLACPQIHLQSHASFCTVWATTSILRGTVGLFRVVSLYQATGRRTGGITSCSTFRFVNVSTNMYFLRIIQCIDVSINNLLFFCLPEDSLLTNRKMLKN